MSSEGIYPQQHRLPISHVTAVPTSTVYTTALVALRSFALDQFQCVLLVG